MPKSLSVLIVDDNLSNAQSLEDILEFKGYQVHKAKSGDEALEILLHIPIDILLSDIIMPGMNGVELCRVAKKSRPNLITFLMTAYATDELIQQGESEALNTILIKPVNIGSLLAQFSAAEGLNP